MLFWFLLVWRHNFSHDKGLLFDENVKVSFYVKRSLVLQLYPTHILQGVPHLIILVKDLVRIVHFIFLGHLPLLSLLKNWYFSKFHVMPSAWLSEVHRLLISSDTWFRESERLTQSQNWEKIQNQSLIWEFRSISSKPVNCDALQP